ncbi:MAG: ATP-binding cassette domain-containing protein [Streptococcaceae bacterium]|jgi:ABC-2 type transport system ATP-binding protein|nr:ATP-binding cassette domain-containing protein [Streptococcaceae bacterium]
MILKVENLSKSYDVQVLENLSLHLDEPTIYGLVGENGAGKTTLLKCLWGLARFDNGAIDILGEGNILDNPSLLRQIGGLIEMPEFYEHLSAKDNLMIHLGCMKMNDSAEEKIQEVLKQVGLGQVGNKKVKGFSLGMKQRLGIARAIIHQPKLLLLDEPLNGLSPTGILEMRELFLSLKNNHEITIIISSHNLYELKQVADRIAVLSDGKIIKEFEAANIEKAEELEDVVMKLMS